MSLFDGLALFLASPTSLWWVGQPPLMDQYPCLADWRSSWLLRRLFGGLVNPLWWINILVWRIGTLLGFSDVALVGWLTPSDGLISLFDGLALFLASLTSLWWVGYPLYWINILVLTDWPSFWLLLLRFLLLDWYFSGLLRKVFCCSPVFTMASEWKV